MLPAAPVRSAGAALAQHAVPGAPRGVRAERVARDRVDKSRARAEDDCRHGHGAFITEAYEGFDINDPRDWTLAESLIDEGKFHFPGSPLRLSSHADLWVICRRTRVKRSNCSLSSAQSSYGCSVRQAARGQG